jgi:hypothetical protein
MDMQDHDLPDRVVLVIALALSLVAGIALALARVAQ